MRIESISFRDFKGVNGTTRVGALNLIVGGNGAGKTAHLLGPQFAIEGKTPLGGRPEDSYALGSTSGCAVGLRFDDGDAFERRLEVDARKKSLGMSISIPGREDLKLRDAEAILSDRFGDFAPMWDIEAFLGLSIDRQRQFILELCSHAGDAAALADPAYLSARCAIEFLRADPECGGAALDTIAHQRFGVTCDKLETIEQMREVVAAASDHRLSKDKREAAKRAINAIHAAFAGGLGESLVAGINRAAELVKEHRAAETRARETARGLSAKVDALNVEAGDILEMRATLDRFREQERDVIQAIGKAYGIETARASHSSRIMSLASDIQAIQDRVRAIEATPIEPLERAAELEIEAETLSRDLASLEERRAALILREAELSLKIEQDGASYASAEATARSATGDSIDAMRTALNELHEEIAALVAVAVQDESESFSREADAAGQSEIPGDRLVCELGKALAHAEADEVAAGQAMRKAQALFNDADSAAKRARQAGPNPWHEAKRLFDDLCAAISLSRTDMDSRARPLAELIDRQAGQFPDIASLERVTEQYRVEYESAREAHRAALEHRMKVEADLRKARDIADQEREARRAAVAELRNRAAASKRAYEDWSARLAAVIERRDRLTVDLARVEEAAKGSGIDLASMKSKLDQLHRFRSDIRDELSSGREAIEAKRIRAGECGAQASAIRDAHKRKADEIATLNARLAESMKAHDEAKAALAGLSADAGGSLDALNAQRAEIEAAIRRAEEQINAKTRFDLLHAELHSAIREAENAAIDYEVCGCMVDALKSLREKIMDQLVSPVVSRMQRFLDVAMPGRRAYCDLSNSLGREDFALGWRTPDAQKIRLQTMSGGERVIFCAALGYALVTLAAPPLRLLLIEAAEVDADNLRSLLDGCEAVSGELSNVMVATCSIGAPDVLPGWTVIHAHRGIDGGNGSVRHPEALTA